MVMVEIIRKKFFKWHKFKLHTPERDEGIVVKRDKREKKGGRN